MQRREFIKLCRYIPGLAVAVTLPNLAASVAFSCELEASVDAGIKTFGFYQGLGPMQHRDPSRSDGTYTGMPCLNQTDVEEGEPATYIFWHGHNGRNHTFTLTNEHFQALQRGETIEVYTNVIDGHRHALKVEPLKPCHT